MASEYTSPTALITFNNCPDKWYKKYVLHMREEVNVHLIKGIAVHQTLDDLFTVKYIGNTYRQQLMKKAMSDIKKNIKGIYKFNIDDKEKEKHVQDSTIMVKLFVNKFCDQIEALLIAEKATNPNHAYNLLKPKFGEFQIIDEEVKLKGKLDSIQEDFDGNVVIVDYKTSNKYKNGLSADYRLQLELYAYLYFKKYNKLPNYVCINYLRFGDSFYVEVNDDMVKRAKQVVINFWDFIKTHSEEKDYCKNRTKLCEYCSFNEECKKEQEAEKNAK